MNQNIGFLLDMDGVIYRGATISPGTSDFIGRLRNHGIPFRFLDLVPDEFIFENLAILAQ